ncbi:hypothetical protein H696_03147 [Fonticula alba]|uniref:RecQ mediated genome instability protein 1 OB-fold domain-containing protein n=1 Tax=Fonticula alba TaxID=691883 RepID=A0A058Z9K6_FONAL|nr:hypothetical protein H696_03147 [Fonticula alba]KCV70796.1 hypothetical protein H696_03147 [Fonticula alba]|eukprot:XP_009495312.1 hypothetical protein H696_03147 [Fonticula alba]
MGDATQLFSAFLAEGLRLSDQPSPAWIASVASQPPEQGSSVDTTGAAFQKSLGLFGFHSPDSSIRGPRWPIDSWSASARRSNPRGASGALHLARSLLAEPLAKTIGSAQDRRLTEALNGINAASRPAGTPHPGRGSVLPGTFLLEVLRCDDISSSLVQQVDRIDSRLSKEVRWIEGLGGQGSSDDEDEDTPGRLGRRPGGAAAAEVVEGDGPPADGPSSRPDDNPKEYVGQSTHRLLLSAGTLRLAAMELAPVAGVRAVTLRPGSKVLIQNPLCICPFHPDGGQYVHRTHRNRKPRVPPPTAPPGGAGKATRKRAPALSFSAGTFHSPLTVDAQLSEPNCLLLVEPTSMRVLYIPPFQPTTKTPSEDVLFIQRTEAELNKRRVAAGVKEVPIVHSAIPQVDTMVELDSTAPFARGAAPAASRSAVPPNPTNVPSTPARGVSSPAVVPSTPGRAMHPPAATVVDLLSSPLTDSPHLAASQKPMHLMQPLRDDYSLAISRPAPIPLECAAEVTSSSQPEVHAVVITVIGRLRLVNESNAAELDVQLLDGSATQVVTLTTKPLLWLAGATDIAELSEPECQSRLIDCLAEKAHVFTLARSNSALALSNAPFRVINVRRLDHIDLVGQLLDYDQI